MKLLHAVAIAAIACGLAAASAEAGTGATPPVRSYARAHANVVIVRAPNFGYQEHMNLFIDGRYVTTLSYGRRFEGALPAGEHFITMQQVPHLNDAYPVSYQRIVVRPGQTNVFTAIWRDGGTRIALEES
jgi:hypothetical protein